MAQSPQVSDVVVIGGGVAGAASAAWLADNGYDVLLLEKESGPHNKVCGGFLGPAALGYLRGLGITPSTLGAQDITRLRINRGDQGISSDLPFMSAAVSRRKLDEQLLQKAVSRGVSVMRPARVNHLVRECGAWSIRLHEGKTIRAAAVFLATGKHEMRGWQRQAFRRKNDYIGFKSHFRMTSAQCEALDGAIEIYFFDGGYAGLVVTEQGTANLCLVVRRKQFAVCGNKWEQFLAFIMLACPALAERLQQAVALHSRPLAIYGLPYGYVHAPRPDDPPHLYRVGDQMGVIPSFSGEGIAIALHTACNAVEHYRRASHSEYHRKLNAELCPIIKRASRISFLINAPVIQDVVFSAGTLWPELAGLLAKKIRVEVSP